MSNVAVNALEPWLVAVTIDLWSKSRDDLGTIGKLAEYQSRQRWAQSWMMLLSLH
jgi:hypothetical protein